MTATNWRNSAMVLLVLASVTACQAADLSGTTWTVTRLAGAELTDRPPTLEIDAPDGATLPSLVEPLWLQLGAAVDAVPVMNADELAEGLSRLG